MLDELKETPGETPEKTQDELIEFSLFEKQALAAMRAKLGEMRSDFAFSSKKRNMYEVSQGKALTHASRLIRAARKGEDPSSAAKMYTSIGILTELMDVMPLKSPHKMAVIMGAVKYVRKNIEAPDSGAPTVLTREETLDKQHNLDIIRKGLDVIQGRYETYQESLDKAEKKEAHTAAEHEKTPKKEGDSIRVVSFPMEDPKAEDSVIKFGKQRLWAIKNEFTREMQMLSSKNALGSANSFVAAEIERDLTVLMDYNQAALNDAGYRVQVMTALAMLNPTHTFTVKLDMPVWQSHPRQRYKDMASPQKLENTMAGLQSMFGRMQEEVVNAERTHGSIASLKSAANDAVRALNGRMKEEVGRERVAVPG